METNFYPTSAEERVLGFKVALEQEKEENWKYSQIVQIVRPDAMSTLPELRDISAFHFRLILPGRGAALLATTWALAALSADCAPIEEVQFIYTNHSVTATIFVGAGYRLLAGMSDFLGLLAIQNVMRAFMWEPDVLPWYSHVAANALSHPEHFDQLGAALKMCMEKEETVFFPGVLCPCLQNLTRDTNSRDSRSKVLAIIKSVQNGSLRWRNLGAA
ncbi:hypothetical protein [Comamonas odontotermitis]|uniref:hypothetical protein n=1 Tax=Comamonas odontotermitis TaxID=379895 RepID=UPI001CC6BFB2|nr:hypothetical protein [Comamonas odontotermitis]UBB18548.1 hypothetical protein LAD35_07905 [Comamonas odontotermitis]